MSELQVKCDKCRKPIKNGENVTTLILRCINEKCQNHFKGCWTFHQGECYEKGYKNISVFHTSHMLCTMGEFIEKKH